MEKVGEGWRGSEWKAMEGHGKESGGHGRPWKGASVCAQLLAEEVGDLEVLARGLGHHRRVVEPRAEEAARARLLAVREVAAGADDAHLRRRLVTLVGRELHHDCVLDEVKVLGVLTRSHEGARVRGARD